MSVTTILGWMRNSVGKSRCALGRHDLKRAVRIDGVIGMRECRRCGVHRSVTLRKAAKLQSRQAELNSIDSIGEPYAPSQWPR